LRRRGLLSFFHFLQELASRITLALTEVDRSLLARCLEHHPGAWRDFVDRFIGLFVHVVNHTAHARSVRLSSDDIDDLCAEVFLTLLADDFAALRRFRGRCSLATYLAVIARRVVVREIARRRKAEALGHVPAHQASLDRAGSGPVHEGRIDDEDEVQAMLAGLGERDASVVRHFHLEGRSYSEISQLLGIPENSIGPTLARARGRLRQQNVKS
tara:strand:- start:109 stop:750 length:642 start_codon:yes stop_codon:yes gene_type:complete